MENNHILTNEEFEIFQKFSIKMTPNTKKDYLSKVILFKEVIKVDNILDVTKDDCKNFIEFIEDEYALSTCEKIFSYLHSFYAYMKREKYIEINPFTFVKKPIVTREKGKKDVLSIQEINQLIDSLHKLNARDRLIMVFLVTTGCLLNELVKVKWKDLIVDENDNFYVRIGQGKKERVVKLHPYCFKLIESYRYFSGLSEVIIPTDDYIFTTQKSQSITDRNVRLIVKKAFDIAGLPQYSAKDLRHSYAAISLMLGADKEDIKKQLGWSDKYYAIRYKHVLNFVDSESIDYLLEKDNFKLNKK
ncbi:MAG: tyrosine-type recombinase/integrase [Clostridiales bacterium]|uniref:tyrosine-type recombinase/integrase n=1 Tax=Terrisporobacter sp. TaxID=1965305 RepID=UPI002A40DA5A|nr:tyrosine-type recombinase/integrase [Terrisporobacter sp.]MCI6456234.1 tyrosine-type recombinase/integrase [Clostridium sp.]MDD5879731.1 tyrosine-type recombinase/integrase [Clostridiales bacterium]MCI7206958.1 tyrosine-type recombinase/integrase [Clostridium sp.]MDD7756506.1 tyrosine-type recombinase/integrase [Clostridiales bacterium]MDY4136150.1 tyrosine-type recombinase/integrase [Terrisporobacter sp.]